MKTIMEAIWDFGTTDSAFNTAIGGSAILRGNMFDTAAPEATAFPYCVVTNLAADTELCFGSQRIEEANIRISTYAGGLSSAYSVHTLLRARFDLQELTTVDTGTGLAMIPDGTIGPVRLPGGDYWVISQDYRIRVFS